MLSDGKYQIYDLTLPPPVTQVEWAGCTSTGCLMVSFVRKNITMAETRLKNIVVKCNGVLVLAIARRLFHPLRWTLGNVHWTY